MIRTFLLVFVSVMTVAAQPVGVGIKVGVPLTEAYDTVSETTRGVVSKTRNFIVGPQFELRLPAGFAIELDALYTRTKFTPRGAANIVADFTSDSWEFPLLLKYKFASGVLRPFVDAGASFRRLSGLGGISDFITGNRNNVDDSSIGFVIGGGLEVKALFIRVTPEIRFTRWGANSFASGIAGLPETNRNQGQFLVGVSF